MLSTVLISQGSTLTFAALRVLGVAALHALDVGVDDALAVLAHEATAAGPGGGALTPGN